MGGSTCRGTTGAGAGTQIRDKNLGSLDHWSREVAPTTANHGGQGECQGHEQRQAKSHNKGHGQGV